MERGSVLKFQKAKISGGGGGLGYQHFKSTRKGRGSGVGRGSGGGGCQILNRKGWGRARGVPKFKLSGGGEEASGTTFISNRRGCGTKMLNQRGWGRALRRGRLVAQK